MHIGWYIDGPSPGRAPSPGRRSLGFSARRSTPSDAWKAYTDRGIRTPASTSPDSVQPATIEPLHQPQEDTLPRIPGQQAIHQTTAPADDLAGHLDHRRTERPKLHPQQRSLLGPMLLSVPERLGHQQRGPGLQAPSQTSHDHVRPVADQVVHRGGQGVHAPFELGHQVLLVAPATRRQHDLIGRHLAVIGDEEEVAVLLSEPHTSLLNGQSLAEQAWDGSTVRFRSTKSLSGPACRDEPRFYQNRCDGWSVGQRLVTRSDDILPAAE